MVRNSTYAARKRNSTYVSGHWRSISHYKEALSSSFSEDYAMNLWTGNMLHTLFEKMVNILRYILPFTNNRMQSRKDSSLCYHLQSRGGYRSTATFKMELFVIIVNDFQPLAIITKCSILHVAAVLDPPLIY